MAEAQLLGPRYPTQIGVRADTTDAGLLERLGEALGAALPTSPAAVARNGSVRVLWLGPDEWLVVDDEGSVEALLDPLEEATKAGFATAVDLSSNRVLFELEGAGAADVLSGGVAIDLHPRGFADGQCAQTLMARAPVLLERDRRFRIYVRPSFAPYAVAWLEDSLSPVEAPRDRGQH